VGIILAVLGICIGLFSAGIAFVSLSSSFSLLPRAHLYDSTIRAYWVTGNVLVFGAVALLLVFVILGVSRLFIRYKITWGEVPLGDGIPINFQLAWWKKSLLIGMFPDLGEVRAEVKYRYDESLRWQHNSVAQWQRKSGVEAPEFICSSVIINGTSSNKLITIFQRMPDNGICTIHRDHQVLPNQFEYLISVIREDNQKTLNKHIGSYRVDDTTK
jgi:hypothetical protein